LVCGTINCAIDGQNVEVSLTLQAFCCDTLQTIGEVEVSQALVGGTHLRDVDNFEVKIGFTG